MNVLITGADGFIGRALARALQHAGEHVVGCARNRERFERLFPGMPFVHADLTRDHDPTAWRPRLDGIDAVVNTVGIFREHGAQRFDTVHVRGPIALFDACVRCRVRRVVQISALGADANAASRYHMSKKAADDYLTGLDLDWLIVQPSLVYGIGGASAGLFNFLAALPIVPLPGRGDQPLQPVHLDDLIDALMVLLRPRTPARRRVAFVGPRPIALRDYLRQLRDTLDLPSTLYLPVPPALVRAGARAMRGLPASLLAPESLDMLERGNTADAGPITALLGRPPRPPRDFIPPASAAALRRQARLTWLLPLLRVSIALVWLVSGVVSLGIYPIQESYALLARAGITGVWAPLALYGAALLDLAFGIATLAVRRGRRLWELQIGVILVYSAIVAWALPEFWLHPFGPLIKNVPMLAALATLLTLEE
ncbi:MAG: SDR family oxidoreductase [Sulfurifustaceae bacterium]